MNRNFKKATLLTLLIVAFAGCGTDEGDSSGSDAKTETPVPTVSAEVVAERRAALDAMVYGTPSSQWTQLQTELLISEDPVSASTRAYKATLTINDASGKFAGYSYYYVIKTVDGRVGSCRRYNGDPVPKEAAYGTATDYTDYCSLTRDKAEAAFATLTAVKCGTSNAEIEGEARTLIDTYGKEEKQIEGELKNLTVTYGIRTMDPIIVVFSFWVSDDQWMVVKAIDGGVYDSQTNEALPDLSFRNSCDAAD